MLTQVTPLPVDARPVSTTPASPAPTAASTQVPKPGTRPSNAGELQPEEGDSSYGEGVKQVTFEGFLHRAIGHDEEPAPAPNAHLMKSPAPGPKPPVKGRAIGGLLPIDIHQKKTDPLPLAASFPIPAPSETTTQFPAVTDHSEANHSGPHLQQRDAALLNPSDVQQLVPKGAEAFSVRISSDPPVSPEISKPKTLVAEQPGTFTTLATTVSSIPATTAISPVAAPSESVDVKPPLTGSAAPVTSIESTESPAPIAAPASPVRGLALHLPGNKGVELRMTERSGEVRVEVHSADREFTQDLRDNLHELVSGLERKGFSAEVSHPGEHFLARAGEASSSNDSPSDGRGGAFAREQEQKQQRQPDQKFDGRSPKARAAEWSETFNFNPETRDQ